jgi:hypothetical protein
MNSVQKQWNDPRYTREHPIPSTPFDSAVPSGIFLIFTNWCGQMTTAYSKNNKTTLKTFLLVFFAPPWTPLFQTQKPPHPPQNAKKLTKFIAIDAAVLERSIGLLNFLYLYFFKTLALIWPSKKNPTYLSQE